MAELDLTNIAVASISTPASGVTAAFVDGTNAPTKRLRTKDDAGTVVIYVGQDTTDALSNKTIITAVGSTTVAPLVISNGGSLLTTPVTGALENDGVVIYGTNDVASGRGILPIINVYKTITDGSIIGTTIADLFPATSSYPTILNGVYEFLFYLYFLKTTAGTITWTLTNTQTYTNLNGEYIMTPIAGVGTSGTPQTAAISKSTAAASAFPVTGILATGVDHQCMLHAIVACGTAGNIRLRVTNSAGTVTLRTGSYYTVRKVSTGSTGTFVA